MSTSIGWSSYIKCCSCQSRRWATKVEVIVTPKHWWFVWTIYDQPIIWKAFGDIYRHFWAVYIYFASLARTSFRISLGFPIGNIICFHGLEYRRVLHMMSQLLNVALNPLRHKLCKKVLFEEIHTFLKKYSYFLAVYHWYVTERVPMSLPVLQTLQQSSDSHICPTLDLDDGNCCNQGPRDGKLVQDILFSKQLKHFFWGDNFAPLDEGHQKKENLFNKNCYWC